MCDKGAQTQALLMGEGVGEEEDEEEHHPQLLPQAWGKQDLFIQSCELHLTPGLEWWEILTFVFWVFFFVKKYH